MMILCFDAVLSTGRFVIKALNIVHTFRRSMCPDAHELACTQHDMTRLP